MGIRPRRAGCRERRQVAAEPGSAGREPTPARDARELSDDRPPGADVPQPPAASQLSALLRGTDRVARRVVDAERRARLARALPLPLAAGDRRAPVLPVRAVHAARPVRRIGGRPARHTQARPVGAGGGDGNLGGTRRRDADGHGVASDRVRPRGARWDHSRPRCSRTAVAHLSDGRAERAAECRGVRTRVCSTPRG